MTLRLAFLQVIVAFEPTDVIFEQRDLQRQRHVLVQPGDNVLLIEAWSKEELYGGVLPHLLRRFRIPEDWHGHHVLQWLPNTTLQVVQFADLRQPSGANVDGDLTVLLQTLFKKKLRARKAKKLRKAFLRLLEQTFGEACMDDPLASAPMERKLYAVLAFLSSDSQRLAWLLRNLLDDGYISGDEMCFTGEGDSFQLRLHVWHRFEENFGTQVISEIHEHGRNLFASIQIEGELKHYVFRRGGKRFAESKLQPYIRVNDESNGNEEEADVIWLNQTEMEGEVAVVTKGTNYIFPSRWVHGVLPPTGDGAMTLELRISVGNAVACDDMRIGIVQLQDSGNTSEQMESAFKEKLPTIREIVANYLEADLPRAHLGTQLAMLLSKEGQEL